MGNETKEPQPPEPPAIERRLRLYPVQLIGMAVIGAVAAAGLFGA